MRPLVLVLVLSHFVSTQTPLDDKFKPLLKFSRLFFANAFQPRTFETGYEISLKNNVNIWRSEFYVYAN